MAVDTGYEGLVLVLVRVYNEHMFDSWGVDHREAETEDLESLVAKEAQIAGLRAEQVEILRRLDRDQVDLAEGARTMGDWVVAHLDVSHQTASRLLAVAHSTHPGITGQLRSGRIGLDRASILARLHGLGGPPEVISDSSRYSLGHLFGLVDRLRRIGPDAESFDFESRYLVIQPNLEGSSYRLWGELPGHDGQVVEKALTQRESELPCLPDQNQGQRAVDALTSICLDSLTGTGETGRAVTVAEIFVSASLAAPSYGEAGVTVSSGPRVGPNTLAEILCAGKVRVILTEGDQPVRVSDLGEGIPPAVRSGVFYRDQGRCVIDGCRSRYRLQPHHLRPRSEGGTHHVANLASFVLVPPSRRHSPDGDDHRPHQPTPPPPAHRLATCQRTSLNRPPPPIPTATSARCIELSEYPGPTSACGVG